MLDDPPIAGEPQTPQELPVLNYSSPAIEKAQTGNGRPKTSTLKVVSVVVVISVIFFLILETLGPCLAVAVLVLLLYFVVPWAIPRDS